MCVRSQPSAGGVATTQPSATVFEVVRRMLRQVCVRVSLYASFCLSREASWFIRTTITYSGRSLSFDDIWISCAKYVTGFVQVKTRYSIHLYGLSSIPCSLAAKVISSPVLWSHLLRGLQTSSILPHQRCDEWCRQPSRFRAV